MAAAKKKRGWVSTFWKKLLGASRPKVEPESLTTESEWRDIMVASARGCTAHAKAHEERAAAFLRLGFGIALAGLVAFLSLIGGYQWKAALSGRDRSVWLDQQRKNLIRELEQVERFSDDEMKRKFALLDLEKTARETMKDPEQLRRFEEHAQKAVRALEDSDNYRKGEFSKDLRDFEHAVDMLKIVVDSEDRFLWNRDLLPLARSAAVLFFFEVFAGVLLALSRRHDALALLWSKQRASCERVLALPGVLADMKESGVPVTDAVVEALMSTDGALEQGSDANPVADALRSALSTVTSKGEKTASAD